MNKKRTEKKINKEIKKKTGKIGYASASSLSKTMKKNYKYGVEAAELGRA